MEIPDKDLYLPQLQFARFGYQVLGFGSTSSREVSHLLTEGWFGSRHFTNGMDSSGVGSSPDRDRISYKSSTSDGDAGDFGNLVYGWYNNGGNGTGASKARGIAGGRYSSSSSSYSKAIDYYATTSETNASAFGDADTAASSGMGMSNGTLLFMAGGTYPVQDRMEYITIASEGNGTDAGDINTGTSYSGASCSGDTRGGIFGGTGASGDINTAVYITFHTTNDSADFGTLTVATTECTALSSLTRWVMKSGFTWTGPTLHINMDYWAADTGGTAQDFGDITARTRDSSGMADGTRGEFWGGQNTTGSYGAYTDAIAYITIASADNADDVGNLHAVARMDHIGLSGAAS